MRTADNIPPIVHKVQVEVSNPDVSAWVAANAGSGKTHVLAQRVINLLLKGVAPEKILCITFTKAAAANMAKRVFDTLGAWTKLDDDDLDKAIRASGLAVSAATRTLARRLFATALETPGGLKVQTIHAFCAQLLHQFPFEANVAARFSVLDDAEQTQMLETLTLAVLLQGAEGPASPIGQALAVAMTAGADQTFREVVRAAIAQGDTIRNWIKKSGGKDQAIGALSVALGVEPALTLADVEREIVNGPILPPSEWQAVAAACQMGSANDQKQGARLALAFRLSGREQVETYFGIFFDSKCQPRSNLLTRTFARREAALAQRLLDEQNRVVPLRERRNAILCRNRSAALMTVASGVLERYGKEKQRRGLVDYNDLIDKALDLLRNTAAQWVHFKLDLGVDHLLIDEAQDTSAKQWEIVQRLVAEFTAGAGARPGRRTIFAVGDEKQSIFSFQNAAPHEFAAMLEYFRKRHEDSGLKFEYRQLEHSFRSCDSVLSAVDIVFKAIAGSVTSDSGGFPPHIALPDAPPGAVEIWDTIKPEKREPIQGWDAPFDTVSEVSPRVKLARRIARTVRCLVDKGEPVGLDRRAARYGDLLVLVRQRGSLFEAIIRALKNEGVEVAGADRLVLTQHIAVMDLMALADALLLPHDDLALAAVLRSPLFGFSDQDLFDIASGRGRKTLRTALAAHAGARFTEASARLEALAAMMRRDAPFGFFAHVLGAGGGRARFLARLGLEANDALDEFLNLALDYERHEAPSLQGFLAWLREARAEIKRDMEIKRDEVRVMTVHGAKGLEAPIIILADTITPPAGPRPPRLLKLGDGPLIWVTRKADDVAPVRTARQQALRDAEDEYRRLLYVAMTRAADRLIVCGAEGVRGRPAGCWYDLMREPLSESLIEERDNGETVWRYRKSAAAAAGSPAPGKPAEKPKPVVLPPWLRAPVLVEPQRPIVLSPSTAFEDDDFPGAFVPAASSATDRRKALARGTLVHRLMQSLPDIPAARRRQAAASFLKTRAKSFSPHAQAKMIENVLAILDDRTFADVFAEHSRVELPIVGRFKRDSAPAIHVSGQIDRLSVRGDTILIADYKTDRRVPESLGEVASYVTQLALYRAVLERLYPGKTVRAALLFTEGPRLMEVPAADMAAALGKVLSQGAHAPVKVP